MERPYVICHMMVSLDGKIIGDFMSHEDSGYFYEQYGKIMMNYPGAAGMVGRVSLQEMGIGDFEAKAKDVANVPKVDHVVNKEANYYTIAVDPSGRLGWTQERTAEGKEMNGEHVIEIITEKASDAYLYHLQDLGISYIFGGKETIDFNIVLEKLRESFSIEKLLVLGGGTLNGYLMNEGLIDEISLIVMPFVDGVANSKTVFDTNPDIKKYSSAGFVLKGVEKLENNGLWLQYIAKK